MVVERRRGLASDTSVYVRLTHKHADMIDGVDLSDAHVGDHLYLPSREAALLISEGWAVASPELSPADRCLVPVGQQDAARAETRTTKEGHYAEATDQNHSPPPTVTSSGREHDPAAHRCIQHPAARMST